VLSVYVREVEWTSSNGYKKEWSDWLQKLSEKPSPLGVREIIIEQREIAPGARVCWPTTVSTAGT